MAQSVLALGEGIPKMGLRAVLVASFVLSLAACGSESSEEPWELTNAPDNPFPCLHPVPADDWGQGFQQCDNGLVFRPVPVTCPATALPEPDDCLSDSDCEYGGYCDCGDDAMGVVNYCDGSRDGECNSDRDCAAGFHCGHGIAGSSDAAIWYMRCQKPLDECVVSEDCSGFEQNTSGTGPACQARMDRRVCCTFQNGCLES
jgi:hypothetical protein